MKYQLLILPLLASLSAAVAAQTANEAGAASDGTSKLAPAKKKNRYLEEVFVTVSKREESVQDVGSAVSAFSADMLKANDVVDFRNLADLTPGMVTRNDTSVTIRGIGRGFAGASPVAFHENGFFLPGAIKNQYTDIEAIEVLRGPSGTAYGRNATGGAINVRWARPVPEWDAGFELRGGNFNERRMTMFMNAPLLDDGKLMLRVAAGLQQRDGWTDDLLAPDQIDPNNSDNHFYRAFLSSDITENWTLAFRAIRWQAEGMGVASPTEFTRRSGILEELGAQPLPPDDLTIVRSGLQFEQGLVTDHFSRVEFESKYSIVDSWIGSWDIDFLIGRHQGSEKGPVDLDGTEATILHVFTDKRGFIENGELRFTSQGGEFFNWIVGLFWARETTKQDLGVDITTIAGAGTLLDVFGGGISLPFDDPTGLPTAARADIKGQISTSKAEAMFLNVTYDLQGLGTGLPDVRIFGGLRQNRDFSFFKNHTVATADLDSNGEPETEVVNSRVRNEFDVKQPTGEIGAKWFYSEASMIYGKYALGYKPGRTETINGVLNEVDAELLNAYEIGWKTELLDGAMVLNMAAFTYIYDDLQVAQVTPEGVKTDNAASADINGFELEMQYAPNEAFHSQIAFSWLDATFNEFCQEDVVFTKDDVDPGCPEELPSNLGGNTLAESPEYSITLLMRYTMQLGDWGSLTPSVKIAWYDEYELRPFAHPEDHRDAYTRTDIRLTWKSLDEQWRVVLFGESLEDDDQRFTSPISFGTPNAQSLFFPSQPRTYGLSVQYDMQ